MNYLATDERYLSDLASNYEYITIEKAYLAVSESQKPQVNRQQFLNDKKQGCCYICDSRPEFAISCKYLGSEDGKPTTQIEIQKIEPQTTTNYIQTPEVDPPKLRITTFCSTCNIEMIAKKEKIAINGKDGAKTTEGLPVTIYECPHCGRIEFRASK
jgi:hypothetical protein